MSPRLTASTVLAIHPRLVMHGSMAASSRPPLPTVGEGQLAKPDERGLDLIKAVECRP